MQMCGMKKARAMGPVPESARVDLEESRYLDLALPAGLGPARPAVEKGRRPRLGKLPLEHHGDAGREGSCHGHRHRAERAAWNLCSTRREPAGFSWDRQKRACAGPLSGSVNSTGPNTSPDTTTLLTVSKPRLLPFQAIRLGG